MSVHQLKPKERPITEIITELSRHSQRPMLVITRDDVIGVAEERGVTAEEVDAHWRSFEKGTEWGLMEPIWDMIEDVLSDIVAAREKPA